MVPGIHSMDVITAGLIPDMQSMAGFAATFVPDMQSMAVITGAVSTDINSMDGIQGPAKSVLTISSALSRWRSYSTAISITRIRCPAIRGLPPQIPGVASMYSRMTASMGTV